MIAARNLTLAAGARTLLRDVTFEIARGELAVLLGPNGIGKTTLLRALAGVLTPQNGCVAIGAEPIAELHPSQRARLVAHIAAEEIFADRLDVRDVVNTGRYAHHRWWEWREEPRDLQAVNDAMRAVGMETFAQRSFDTLSSGERQRVWLAMALAQEAPVLLLDEPTSHLDIRVAHGILHLLRAQAAAGKTIVCVLHDVNEAAEFADRVLLLGEERLLADGAPDSVFATAALETAYGMPMERMRTANGAIRVFPAAPAAAQAEQA